MGPKLRDLVGALKDTASLSKAALTSPAASAHLAVLRATPHLPSTEPPSTRHLAALLSFGRGSRLTASALVSALSSRLHSTGDPSVALKALLALHLLLSHGAFILRDQVAPALLRHPSSGRNPLALSSFRSTVSYSLSAWVRWFARLLELLLLIPSPNPDTDRLTALLNHDLLAEMDSLVAVAEEIHRAPEGPAVMEGNRLVFEAVRQAEEEWATAERDILVRVREIKERLGSLRFADSVELLCLLKRIEELKHQPSDWKWMVWDERLASEVGELKKRAEELVVRREEEERRVRRERASASARIPDRIPSGFSEPVRSGLNRSGSNGWPNR